MAFLHLVPWQLWDLLLKFCPHSWDITLDRKAMSALGALSLAAQVANVHTHLTQSRKACPQVSPHLRAPGLLLLLNSIFIG